MTLTGQKLLSIYHTIQWLKEAWEQHGGEAGLPTVDAHLDAAQTALDAAKAELERVLAARGNA